MAKFYQLPMMLLAAGTLLLAPDASAKRPENSTNYFPYAQKANYSDPFEQQQLPAKDAQRLNAPAPVLSLKSDVNFGYLNGPANETWYYTAEYVKEIIEHEAYTETKITGYVVTVYDAQLKEVGKVTDTITLQGDETQVADIMVDPTITKKFFNTDNNYELIVSLVMNRDFSQNPYPYLNYYSKAYTIGAAVDENGNTPCIITIPGYNVGSINAATASWDENFYIAFMKETGDISLNDQMDFLRSCKYILNLYKKAGYSGGASVAQTFEVPQLNLPGDQMSSPFFLATMKGTKPVFAIIMYEKSFYTNPVGEDESITEDNNLLIDLYSTSYSGLEQIQSTKIPTTPEVGEGYLYTYYSIGSLRYNGDIDFGNMVSDSDKAAFVVCKEVYTTASDDDYLTSYHIYNGDGQQVSTLCENVLVSSALSDLDGFEPQQLFIVSDGNDGFLFRFVDLYSGAIVAELPQVFEDYTMRSLVDRVLVNNGTEYYWWVSLADVVDDEQGCTHEKMALIRPASETIQEVIDINLGTNVNFASPNLNGQLFSPYIFDTDDEHEFMFLVKRSTGVGSTTQEELVITKPDGTVVLQLTPDEEKGKLATISTCNIGTKDATLYILYITQGRVQTLTHDFYNLPLTKFALGGDGSEESPYQIATVGDLQAVELAPAAFYQVANDFTAFDYNFRPIAAPFTGSIDGQSHTITGLGIQSSDDIQGIFATLHDGSVVKNLNFNLTNITDKGNAQFIGLLGGESLGTTISNVHVTDLTISTDASACVGGLVGNLALYSTVNDCSVRAANIEAINGSNVGGIVGASHTTSAIKACAFTGELDGNNAVGGIVGSSDGNCEIRNCHVNADIYANHTVGGVVGYSKRDVVANNFIEGYITSMLPSWDGPATGGVVGYLESDYTGNEAKIISGNVVALNQILAATSESEPSWETQYLTAHRIVGRTAVNEEAEIVDYDRSHEDWWNYPIYGDPLPADLGLANNYAVSTLNAFDAEISGAESTEGASIERASINQEFLAGIDFAFGEATDTPWKESAAAAVLYFEDAAQPFEFTIPKGEYIQFVLSFPAVLGATDDEVKVKYSSTDELIAFVEPHAPMGNSSYQFTVNALNEGVVQSTVTYLGATLVLNITVGPAGVTDITVDRTQTITFDGATVKADGAIRVYNAAGIQVAAGRDTVAVDHLTPGIYVAVSNDSTLKFRK